MSSPFALDQNEFATQEAALASSPIHTLSNLTQFELQHQHISSFNERSKNSTGYQESLGKILGVLQEKSSPVELLLGEFFMRIYKFER